MACAGYAVAALLILVVGGVATAYPFLWNVVAAGVFLVLRARARQHRQDPQPLPSPTELGPEDYITADGTRVVRKREGVGWSVQPIEKGK